MKNRNLFVVSSALFVISILFSLSGLAQTNRLTKDDLAHPFGHSEKDSVYVQNLINRLSVYDAKYRDANQTAAEEYWEKNHMVIPDSLLMPIPDSAYILWRKLIDKAPCNSYNYYSNNNIEYKFGPLLAFEKNPALKVKYFKDILEILDKHIYSNDIINEMRKQSGMRAQNVSEAEVLRAHYYYKYGKYVNAPLYTEEEAYKEFKKAFADMEVYDGKNETEILGIYLQEYFDVCCELYRMDSTRFESVLQDYIDCRYACDKMLNPAYNLQDSLKRLDIMGKYYPSRQYIENKFHAMNIATPEKLNQYFMAKLSDHRQDKDYLNQAIQLMIENSSMKTDAFMQYCETSYSIEPTWQNCYGCALICEQDGSRDEMIDYLKQATSLTRNDYLKACFYYLMGNSLMCVRPSHIRENGIRMYYGSGDPEEINFRKQGSTSVAAFKNVLALSDSCTEHVSIEVKRIPARAAFNCGLMLGRMASRSNDYDEAIAMIKEAMRLDPDGLAYVQNDLGKDQIARFDELKRKRLEIEKSDRKKRNGTSDERYHREYHKRLQEDAFWGRSVKCSICGKVF